MDLINNLKQHACPTAVPVPVLSLPCSEAEQGTHPDEKYLSEVCVYMYVRAVCIYTRIVQMYSFHLAKFCRCSTQTRVLALHEREGRSGWKRQRLHKLASLPKRLLSNCAWTLKYRCEEMGGDPDRAFSSLQSFDDRRTEVCIYVCTWPHRTGTTPEQIHLHKITTAPCDRELLTKIPARSQYMTELEAIGRYCWCALISAHTIFAKRLVSVIKQECMCPDITDSITLTDLMLGRSTALARQSRCVSYHRHTGGSRNTAKCSQVSFP